MCCVYNTFHTIIPKKAEKIDIFNLTVHNLEMYSGAVEQLAHRVASSEQARRAADWGRERRWELVELKDCQQ